MRITKRDITPLMASRAVRDQKANGKIMTFGESNDYPEVMENLILSSPVGSAAYRVLAAYLAGTGFAAPEVNKVRVGTDGKGKAITVADLITHAASDVAMHNGFYIGLLPNLTADGGYTIKSARPISFRKTRISPEDSAGFSAFVYEASAREKEAKRKWGMFNPHAHAALAQHEAGCAGQCYVEYMDKRYIYPISLFDAAKYALDADAQLDIFRANTLRNGFLDLTTIGIPSQFQDDGSQDIKKEDDFAATVRGALGADGDRVITYTLDRDASGAIDQNSALAINTAKANFDAKVFDSWVPQIAANIRRQALSIPQLLVDFELGAQLGTTSGEAFRVAHELYNALTQNYREAIGLALGEFLKYFDNPILQANTDWSLRAKILPNGTSNVQQS